MELTLLSSGLFAHATQASVIPYPCSIGMPADQKAYESLLLSGAPPETKNRSDPPTPFLHFENTNLSAIACFAASTGEIIIVQDADLEYDPQDYLKLLQPIRDDKADVVFGVRFTPPSRAPYPVSYFINSTITQLSNLFTGLGLSDIETCYKVFRRELLLPLQLQENRFGFDPEFTSKIAGLPCRVQEVSVSYARRSYKEGKKIGFRDGVRALWCILTYPPRPQDRRATRVRGT